MLTPVDAATSADTNNNLLFNAPGSPGSADFTQELAEALESYLGRFGNGSQIEIDVQGGNGQFSITVNKPGPAAPSAIATPAETEKIDKSRLTPDDAYWAEQPSAVQALRYMPYEQRPGAAQELAAQGYTIDVPIMAQGMDPLCTMMQRQADGYTWVPAALQPSLSEGPGINFPGATPYDPDHPPAGSIEVSTDFAIGTNMQSAWVSPQEITATFSNSNPANTTA